MVGWWLLVCCWLGVLVLGGVVSCLLPVGVVGCGRCRFGVAGCGFVVSGWLVVVTWLLCGAGSVWLLLFAGGCCIWLLLCGVVRGLLLFVDVWCCLLLRDVVAVVGWCLLVVVC